MKKISLITTSLKQPQTLIQTWHGEPGIHKKLYQTAGPHHFLQNQQFYPRHLHEANLRLRKIGNFHKKNNNKRKKERKKVVQVLNKLLLSAFNKRKILLVSLHHQ